MHQVKRIRIEGFRRLQGVEIEMKPLMVMIGRPDWDYNPFESALSQVPKMYRQSEELRRILSSVTQYHVLDVGPRAPVKLPQQMKPTDLPGENGEDLIPFLFSLRESNRDCYEAIGDALKAAFPGFSSLNSPPVAAGMLSRTWKEQNFKTPIYMHQLSEGTLRFLWAFPLDSKNWLSRRPIGQRLLIRGGKKQASGYKRVAPQIKDEWENVVRFCSQAQRFHEDVRMTAGVTQKVNRSRARGSDSNGQGQRGTVA
jgi:hypothetical protein